MSTDSRAADYLAFLQSVLNPFLESYWHTALALLQMDNDTEGRFVTAHISLADGLDLGDEARGELVSTA